MSRLSSLFITGSVLFSCIGITLALGALSVYFEEVFQTDVAKGINTDNVMVLFQTTRVLAILFLVFSVLFGFAFGFKLSTSIRKESTNTTGRIHSSKNSHVHIMNFDPYSVPTKLVNQNADNPQPVASIPNHNTWSGNVTTHTVTCYACEKQIYNPFICKICHNNFCGEHILTGDHICMSN